MVTLPSAHEGGELLVRHAGCEHEVRPVVSGNRVCLIYNLILDSRKRDGAPRPPDDRAHVRKASEALPQWASRGDDALDMTHVTERKGSPYTLVCTNARATCERACEQYRKDVADMCRLIVLPPAAHDDLSETAARVYAACAESGAVR